MNKSTAGSSHGKRQRGSARQSLAADITITPDEAVVSAQQDVVAVFSDRSTVQAGDTAQWPTEQRIHIDHAVDAGEVAILSGWTKADVQFSLLGDGVQCLFPRPDIEVIDPESCGFVVVIAKARDSMVVKIDCLLNGVVLPLAIRLDLDPAQLAVVYSEQLQRLPQLMPTIAQADHIGVVLEQALEACRGEFSAMAHIDTIIVFDGTSTTVSGWAFAGPGISFWLSVPNRPWMQIQSHNRIDRPDVSNAFPEHRGLTTNAGFLSGMATAIPRESVVRIVAANRTGFKVIVAAQPGEFIGDVFAYAERVFQFGSPQNDFIARLDNIDGSFIASGLAARVKQRKRDINIKQKAFGKLAKPSVSAIVPIYGRYDFIEHQLIEFSRDPDFVKGRCELLYVIDDPKLVPLILAEASLLYETYKVPFTLVWTGTNMGYSGANNLGASLASADVLLLLNSDVIPLAPMWVSSMLKALQADDSLGALGARLKFADGSIQHVGMEFRYDDALGVWLNIHPSMGLCLNEIVDTSRQIQEVAAATGACLMIQSSVYHEVGGLDEEYLFGDFEDSDLCLKLAAKNRRIAVHHGLNLCHLTRQSVAKLGAADFRSRVVLYNAWRHSRRWNAQIEKITSA